MHVMCRFNHNYANVAYVSDDNVFPCGMLILGYAYVAYHYHLKQMSHVAKAYVALKNL